MAEKDMDRIERNIRKMMDQGAPESDIDDYLKMEGLTPQQFRDRKKPGFVETLKANVTQPFKSGGGPSLREEVAGLKEKSREISKAEGGVKGFISEGLITPAIDVASGLAGLPNAVLEAAPAWASNKLGGLVGGRTDVQPTSLYPSAGDARDAITSTTGLSRNPAESAVGRIAQSGVAGVMATPMFPVAGLLAGAGSEAAGQAAEGTPYEAPARIAAAVLPFGVKAGYSALKPPPGVTIGKALEGLSPRELEQVNALISDARRAGTSLTMAEAIAQVSGRKGPLVAQRAVEESTAQTPNIRRVQDMMRDRPASNRAAFDSTVPPVKSSLSEIAPKAREIADARVKAERSLTNARTKPLYDTTVEVGVIADKPFSAISGNPVLTDAIAAVRKDRIKYGNLEPFPDNHMKVLDATKKYLDDMRDAPDTGLFAKGNVGDAIKSLTKVMDDAYPDYAAARLIQTHRIRKVEDPLKRSATGKIADQETLAGQYRSVFDNPLEVSPDQVRDLIKEISKADPQLAQDFVNRYLKRVFNKAHKPKTTKEAAGSTFSNQIRGDIDIAENIEAAVKALPDGAKRWAALNKVMDIYEAQGRRLPSGSPTQVKQEFASQQRDGLVPRLASLNQGLARKFGDWRYGRNLEQMAELLVMSPQELGRIMMRKSPVVAPTAVQSNVSIGK